MAASTNMTNEGFKKKINFLFEYNTHFEQFYSTNIKINTLKHFMLFPHSSTLLTLKNVHVIVTDINVKMTFSE